MYITLSVTHLRIMYTISTNCFLHCDIFSSNTNTWSTCQRTPACWRL